MEKKFLGTVILPGMFDPLTVGHMNSLRYLSERSDKVCAVIMTLKAEEEKPSIRPMDVARPETVAEWALGMPPVEPR